MIKVIFYAKEHVFKTKTVIESVRDFPDDAGFDVVNKYINGNWKPHNTWKIFKDNQKVSFRKLFHKGFEFKEQQ